MRRPTQKPRLQLETFAINGAKRLLQHNLPGADIRPHIAGLTRVEIGKREREHRAPVFISSSRLAVPDSLSLASFWRSPI
jgi:hypothetical protein